VRIGYQKLGLLMLVKYSGKLERTLDELGARVEWVEYEGGAQMVEALKAGALDVAGLGNGPAVMAQAEHVPIAYFAAEPPAPRGVALVVPADSPAESVRDLRGKRIAVNRGAQAHYLLMCALEEAGLNRDALEVRYEPPERALAAFRGGALDAWAIWDPFLSSARLELGARVLRDATGLASNATYYVARRAYARKNAELLQALCDALGFAARWARGDERAAAAHVAPALGFSERALLASWQRELEPVPVDAELLAAQQRVADTLYRFSLIPRPVRVDEAAWDVRLAG
jgi:sulfonate transport system substrate-binding protein